MEVHIIAACSLAVTSDTYSAWIHNLTVLAAGDIEVVSCIIHSIKEASLNATAASPLDVMKDLTSPFVHV